VNVKRFLTQLGVSALDWHDDFAPARSILDQITEAASRCGGGIFKFTNDDKLDIAGENAIPRDNVVLEAGFFMSAKGKGRVLIVREKGSKIPADLGGDIYASLEDRSDITPIEASIRAFTREFVGACVRTRERVVCRLWSRPISSKPVSRAFCEL
jgi:predicted nucleotide-binding protein